MERDGSNLQNEYFNLLRKERTVVAVYLANGKRLVGRIKSFDRYTLLLDGGHGDQMVFKHAVSTVSTVRGPAVLSSENDGTVGDQAPAFSAGQDAGRGRLSS
jgi:host factor-I protein